MNDESIDWDAIEIELLPEERRVLLQHGYPFEDTKQQLETMAKCKNPIETLVISEFYLSRLTVDLWKSLEQKKIKGKFRTIARSLIERLDFAQRWGYSDIDVM
jgi:hypothetical protein